MSINQSGWRPTSPEANTVNVPASVTGNKALMLEEALIFEIGDAKTTGVDFGEGDVAHDMLGDLTRKAPIGLPGLSEPETVRHYTRLSRQNYGIDLGFFPLGSCTMKPNATSEMIPVTWPEFSNIHPFAPDAQTVGYREMIGQLEDMLCALTGYAAISLQPNAGSQGEYAGLLVI